MSYQTDSSKKSATGQSPLQLRIMRRIASCESKRLKGLIWFSFPLFAINISILAYEGSQITGILKEIGVLGGMPVEGMSPDFKENAIVFWKVLNKTHGIVFLTSIGFLLFLLKKTELLSWPLRIKEIYRYKSFNFYFPIPFRRQVVPIS